MQTAKIIDISGDGENVSIEIETEYGERVLIKQDKFSVRKGLIDRLRSAARHPEKNCTDSIDHWEGHCGCK